VAIRRRVHGRYPACGTLEAGSKCRRHRRAAEYGAVPLYRIAWLTTVGVCLIVCVILLFSSYYGYAGVLLAIALSAAINLR
jgi:hypothetical protein